MITFVPSFGLTAWYPASYHPVGIVAQNALAVPWETKIDVFGQAPGGSASKWVSTMIL